MELHINDPTKNNNHGGGIYLPFATFAMYHVYNERIPYEDATFCKFCEQVLNKNTEADFTRIVEEAREPEPVEEEIIEAEAEIEVLEEPSWDEKPAVETLEE